MERREFTGLLAFSLLSGCSSNLVELQSMEEMYGLIAQMKTADGKRAEVISALLEGTKNMPGNVAYLIAEDLEDRNSIWITEVWRTKTDHANSLQLPSVKAAIDKARPYIAGLGTRVETKPVMGA